MSQQDFPGDEIKKLTLQFFEDKDFDYIEKDYDNYIHVKEDVYKKTSDNSFLENVKCIIKQHFGNIKESKMKIGPLKEESISSDTYKIVVFSQRYKSISYELLEFLKHNIEDDKNKISEFNIILNFDEE